MPLLDGDDVAEAGAGRRSRPPYLYIGGDFREVRVEDTLGAQDRIAFWDAVTALMLDPQRAGSAAGVTAPPGAWPRIGCVGLAVLLATRVLS